MSVRSRETSYKRSNPYAGADAGRRDDVFKLCVCGPAGVEGSDERAAFLGALHRLDDAGFEVRMPTAQFLTSEDATWITLAAIDIRMLDYCDGVALLDGWEDDTVARIVMEVVAHEDMTVASVDEWMDAAIQLQARVAEGEKLDAR